MPEYGESLTEREKEVLQLLTTGITNREIAHQLFISANTVKVHLRNVYTKLGAESRTEATMIAVREGWVVVEGNEESAAGETAEAPAIELEPPLPWPKRAATIVALLLVVAGLVVTWPRTSPQADTGPEFPLDQSETQLVATRAADDTESPWRELAQMPTRRAYLALAVVEGQVLAIGGKTPEGITAVVEAYDLEDDLWTRGSDKPTPVTFVSAAAIGSEVYVPGGCDAEGAPTRVVEVYDAQADSWREVSPLPEPRCAYALATLDEKLYLFGGWDGERFVATVYVYDPPMDAWAEATPMGTARGSAAATSLKGRLYVVGGDDGERELTTCAAYDPTAKMWAECASLTVGRGGLGLVAVGDQLYAIGGGGRTSYLGFNERYNPAADAWDDVKTPLVGEWRGLGAATFENSIYAIGGWSGDYLSVNQALTTRYYIFIPVTP
jgi:DNA-binding CsgD family transcriptional regulator/N-acetylneuraminic acid mutarotase